MAGGSDVNKDWTHKDQDKDKDQTSLTGGSYEFAKRVDVTKTSQCTSN